MWATNVKRIAGKLLAKKSAVLRASGEGEINAAVPLVGAVHMIRDTAVHQLT